MASAGAAAATESGSAVVGHRPVGDDLVDQPSLGPQAVGQHAADPFRPREQDRARPPRSPAGRGGRRSARGRPRPTPRTPTTSGTSSGACRASVSVRAVAGTHGRPADRRGHGAVPERGHERHDGVGRGERHPLVGAGGQSVGGIGERSTAVEGTSMAMTGSSTTVAPGPSSRSTRSEAWARARVTTTVRPARGSPVTPVRSRRSTVDPRSRAATAPMTMVAGDGKLDRGQIGQRRTDHPLAPGGSPVHHGHRRVDRPARGIRAVGDDRPLRHPHQHHHRAAGPAQGVPVDPGADRSPTLAGDHASPTRPSPGGSPGCPPPPGRRTPSSRRAPPRSRRRRVRSASASSPPRPNTNGSPPLSRTTCRPARARAISWALMSAWSADGRGPSPRR